METNSEHVIAAAQQSWGHFRPLFTERPVRLSIGVTKSCGNERPIAPVVRSRRHLLSTVAGSDDFACCDLREGFGFAWLNCNTAADHAHLRYYYLEALVYSMLQSLYLTPLHAACVARDGRGLLLCGESEAGKSTLAYACARSGFTYISDDATYLIRSSDQNKVIGNPHLVRLREPARELFSELSACPITLRAQGDRAMELATADFRDLVTASHASIDYIVFLNRQCSGPPELIRLPRQRVLHWFEKPLCLGDSEIQQAQTNSLRRLLSCVVFEFRYSDLACAVTALESLLSSPPPFRAARVRSTGYQGNA
ncbi:MAG: aldolase [Acidobacteriota bacterium]|nr:aldolase [Acidobacteriota bacterium]